MDAIGQAARRQPKPQRTTVIALGAKQGRSKLRPVLRAPSDRTRRTPPSLETRLAPRRRWRNKCCSLEDLEEAMLPTADAGDDLDWSKSDL